MEELVSSSTAKSESTFKGELLILHSAEAQEWAMYLRKILKSSRKLPRRSIVLYAVGLADHTHGYNFEHFHGSTCIVLLLTAALLNFLEDQEMLGALQRLLYPPQKVVVLLCGVTEDNIPIECFEHWHWWRKLYADDEPAIYLSTILESIADSRTEEAENESKITNDIELKKTLDLENPLVTDDSKTPPICANAEILTRVEGEIPVNADLDILPATEDTEISLETAEFEMPETEVGVKQSTEEVENSPVNAVVVPEWEGTEQGASDKLEESEQEDTCHMVLQRSPSQTLSPNHPICLTVQPNRILCGDQATIFIIFKNKINDLSRIEVGFSSSNVATERVTCVIENEYTISVAAPDMPPGAVSLTLLSDHLSVSAMPVTYYTNMEEVSSYFERASSPMDFICQAFNITSSKTETLDNFLTDSFKSMMPDSGLELFGVGQIEAVNISACKRSSEFPTLLHFAAKYGLKKLATVLFGCPGALQAYSVMNKYGDYPNSLAEKSGFLDLKQFMDEIVLNVDMMELNIKNSISIEEDGDVYEPMSKSTQDIRDCSPDTGCKEDIYESMLELSPECMEDLYEAMEAVGDNTNPEEIMLRKFFQANPKPGFSHHDEEDLHACGKYNEEEDDELKRFEEEDPYNLHPEDIYDTLDTEASYASDIFNRPPAPIPRSSSSAAKPEEPTTYISRVFSGKEGMTPHIQPKEGCFTERSVPDVPSASDYDPYAGIKTPGQKQLIALQEKVKVGALSVDEAVQEFKIWQANQGQRSISIRYQQENLKRLRASITRRHKEKEKLGKELELEISLPLPKSMSWDASMTVECSVYECAPRVGVTPPPVGRPVQRGTWQTGSTSSTSSTESNRLSTHSTVSCSSGTEPDFEDTIDFIPPPPRPPRPADGAPILPPPRLPPRMPQESDSPTRAPEKLHQERYISCPSRAPPQRPTHRATEPPPIPRRLR